MKSNAAAIAEKLVDEDFEKYDGLSSSLILTARFEADPAAYGGTADQAPAVHTALLSL